MQIKIAAVFCLMLSACGGSEFEDAVKSRLKDPDSTKFRSQTVQNDLNLACVEWTSKNGFGGYGEWTVADFKRVDGKWTLLDVEGSSRFSCDESYLKERAKYLDREARGVAAREAAVEEATRILSQARQISMDAAIAEIEKVSNCRDLVKDYSYRAGAIATDHVAEMARKLTASGVKLPDGDIGRQLANPPSKQHEKIMGAQRELLKSGRCSGSDPT